MTNAELKASTWIEIDAHGVRWRVQKVTGQIARMLTGRNSYYAYTRPAPVLAGPPT